MEFLALLIALLLWSYSPLVPQLQRDGIFFALLRLFVGSLPPAVALTLAVLLPAVAVAALLAMLDHQLFGLPALLISVAVVLYGLGRGDLRQSWAHYIDEWQRGNYQAAYQQALQMQALHDDTIESPFALHQIMRKLFCYHAVERWFAPVFWFMTLGPAVILAYRFLHLATNLSGDPYQAQRQLAWRALLWLEWLPERVLALTFALAGNFSSGFQRCQQLLFVAPAPAIVAAGTSSIVGDCAVAALDLPDDEAQYSSPADFHQASAQELRAMQALVRRSRILWLVMIGLLMML